MSSALLADQAVRQYRPVLRCVASTQHTIGQKVLRIGDLFFALPVRIRMQATCLSSRSLCQRDSLETGVWNYGRWETLAPGGIGDRELSSVRLGW